MSATNIVLMGLRGSGKTTAGRALAERLGRVFVDLDDVTPAVMGRTSVAQAWALDGPDAFRRAEHAALAQQLGFHGRVIALGGGTPTAPGAAELLEHHRRQGTILLLYLAATAQQLRSRLAGDAGGHRPSITGGDPLKEIDQVLADRDPLFRRLADHVVDVGAHTEPQTVAELMALVAGRGEVRPRAAT